MMMNMIVKNKFLVLNSKVIILMIVIYIISSSTNKKCLANIDYIEGDNSNLCIEKY